MNRNHLGGLLVLSASFVLVLSAGSGARADTEDDKKKNDREWREAEGEQKKGGQAPGQGGQALPGGMDNPLDKILELMRTVEERLFESDTGDFTQEEQKKIVEAMRFEDKTSQALEELIRKIEEEMQQQQQQQGGGEQQQRQRQQQQQQQQQDQRQNETEEQRRERMEREKREEEQRRMQQQQQQRPQDQQPQNDRQQRGQQDRREGRPPEDQPTLEDRDRNAAGRWGQLPAKLHQDAQNAQNEEPPSRWRDLINRFRERVNSEGNQ